MESCLQSAVDGPEDCGRLLHIGLVFNILKLQLHELPRFGAYLMVLLIENGLHHIIDSPSLKTVIVPQKGVRDGLAD